ncbi:hypothetical protein [Actinoplanes sp. NPDC026623]|uniref:hypothetical protein n=1 Tax=Actinoplanes sp. NPDC026623 TaxID=3155610 RepID=UPI0034117D2A
MSERPGDPPRIEADPVEITPEPFTQTETGPAERISESFTRSTTDPAETAPEALAQTGTEPVEIAPEPFMLTEPAEQEVSRPRSRTRTIVLSSLLAVGLAGASVIGYAGWRIASQKDATLAVPAKIAGLTLDNSEDGRATGDYLQTALSAEVELDDAVGVVLTDESGKDVLFFGGTTLIWTPENDLDTAFGLIADEQGAVTGLHDVPAGPLGGTMKCGTTRSDGADMPVCGWADHGSLALAMFPGRTEADAATLFEGIRSVAQKRD